MLKMIESTKMLIQPCDENKYSGQTQARIYSQILGLRLEIEIEIDITDGSGNSVYACLVVHSHLPNEGESRIRTCLLLHV